MYEEKIKENISLNDTIVIIRIIIRISIIINVIIIRLHDYFFNFLPIFITFYSKRCHNFPFKNTASILTENPCFFIHYLKSPYRQ